MLTFEAVPGSMIRIAGDGTIKSGSATVTVTPTAEAKTDTASALDSHASDLLRRLNPGEASK